MTSVLSSIPWGPMRASRPKPTSAASSLRSLAELLPPAAPEDAADEPADLAELNECLQALTELFPDIQSEVFREMLNSFDGTSRLHVITEALLKNAAKWVRGRYRTPQEHEAEHKYKYKSATKEDLRGVPLATEDKFRRDDYKRAVVVALLQEFKGLSSSTIRGVLAEYNYSYTQARPTLQVLVSKSWRYSITNFFMRRKPPSSKDNPLVRWSPPSNGNGFLVPRLSSTKNWELDKELYDTLIAPVLSEQKEEQIHKDFQLAEQLNEADAEEAGEMYDCECCFIPRTVEQMSACDDEGHYVCHFCIRHAISEALYGQGWARNVNIQRSTLRCLAPVAGGIKDCSGCIPAYSVQMALNAVRDGKETSCKFSERCTTETLLKAQLPLIRCPFCPYAEVDTIALSKPPLPIKLKNRPLIAFTTISLLNLLSSTLIRLLLLWVFLFLTVNYLLPRPLPLAYPFSASLTRLARKRHGLKFACQSPSCRRSSCMSCFAEWRDIHICHESSLTSLRTYIERAMADAVKRTCPDCNLSFVKSSGCNKLTCVCGYTMCYVCRKEIGSEGYAHFCQHFRQDPGKECTECDKCDLYKTEDEDKVARKAKETAEKEWLEREGKEGLGYEWQLDAGAGPPNRFSFEEARKLLRKEVWEKWMDRVLDTIIA